jgi:DNA-binding NtrC family response regulator
MRSHNGAIRVDSAPGQGTTVELYLPIHHGGERSPNVMSQETTRMKAGTGVVMVVDDESSIREMICDALEPMGYEVHGFAGGSEAIEFFQENHHRVGLVILDLIMPRMDGRQTFQRLKEIDPEIHALISTGYGTSEMAKRVIADGVRDFLAKPYRLDELSEMVSKHIRRPD